MRMPPARALPRPGGRSAPSHARRSQAAYGALMAHLMLEPELVADLLGVNPFGQPAVGDTKERIVQILTKVAH